MDCGVGDRADCLVIVLEEPLRKARGSSGREVSGERNRDALHDRSGGDAPRFTVYDQPARVRRGGNISDRAFSRHAATRRERHFNPAFAVGKPKWLSSRQSNRRWFRFAAFRRRGCCAAYGL